MNDQKNIDRLFQEKFKNFERQPNELAWKNIEAALKDDKKDKKVIPIWYKIAGIAATLLLGTLILNNLFVSDEKDNSVVFENENSIKNNNNPNLFKEKKNINNRTLNNQSIVNKEGVADEENNEIKKNTDSGAIVYEKTSHKTNENKTVIKENTIKKTITSKFAKHNNNNAIHRNNNSKNQNNDVLHNKSASSITKAIVNASNYKKEDQNKIIPPSKNRNNNNQIANQVEKNNIHKITILNKIADNNQKDTNFNSLEKSVLQKKTDTITLAAAVPNALEELLKKDKKEATIVAKAKIDRWQITSNVAPVYFSSISNGSPIDSQFASNGKSFDNNISLGLGVNYAVSKKIAIRTGINKFKLGYNTNDVVFGAGLQARSISTITNTSNGAAIIVGNKNSNVANLLPFENGIQAINEGVLKQEMGYYEVPLELSYTILNKKFGINLIGGMSTLFLNENDISVVSAANSARLGKANNLNDIHFSTNLGLGFRYQFMKSFEAKLEPTLKYQINTFTNDSGNFKPYFVGLYSGVSFNF